MGRATDAASSPITQSEMRALLKPLHNCLQGMEITLRELSCGVPPLKAQAVGQTLVLNAKDFQQEVSPTGDVVAASDPRLACDPLSNDEGEAPLATRSEARKQSLVKGEDPLERLATKFHDGEVDDSFNVQARNSNAMNHEKSKVNDLLARVEIQRTLQELDIKQRSDPLDKFAMLAENCLRWWSTVKEPERRSCLFRLTDSKAFETFCTVAIIFNSGLVAYQADWQIRHIGKHEPEAFELLETICLFWFFFELVLRIGAHRLYFFVNENMGWNIVDLVLVGMSVADQLVNLAMSEAESGNVGFMRVIRLFKLARVFRSFRAFKFFRSLAVLLETFLRSFYSLFWGFILLTFLLYLFSLIFVLHMVEFLEQDEPVPEILQDEIMHFFGSISGSMLSLYMAVTGGDDWRMFYAIINGTGNVHALIFVFFTFFFLFAIFNILTGSLVEKAMVSSQQQRTDILMQQRHLEAEQRAEMMELCKGLDLNNDGAITIDEFQRWMRNPVIVSYLASLGIVVHDIELFFGMLGARSSERGGSVKTTFTVDDFVDECMNMQGTASAYDLHRQLLEMHILHGEIKRFQNSCIDRLMRLELVVDRCCSSMTLIGSTAARATSRGTEKSSEFSLRL